MSTVHNNLPPLIAHVIYKLAIGGLENGLVNLINHMPKSRYRHAIICMTDATEFRQRLQRDDVEIIELHKRDGKGLIVYWRMWRTLIRLRPNIVHTRNMAALEMQIPAFFAGVKNRVQSEHGRDLADLRANKSSYTKLRRLMRPLVSQYIALSSNLELWLQASIGVNSERLHQVYNGVDTGRFNLAHCREALPPGFTTQETCVIGTVGRLQPVKDQVTLVKAFVLLAKERPELKATLRLVVIGEGNLRPEIEKLLTAAQLQDCAWLPGARNNIPEIMSAFDVFVLPSISEGISNTILEAMACSLPVVATAVGGNTELVDEGVSGILVPSENPASMAAAIEQYVDNSQLRVQHGIAGRVRVEQHFSMDAMVNAYLRVYDGLMPSRINSSAAKPSNARASN